MNRRDFLKKSLQAGAAGFLFSNDFLRTRLLERHSNIFPELKRFGDRFNFTLVADPQLNSNTTIGTVGGTSAVRYSEMIEEMNNMSPRPAFAALDGDLVGNPEYQSQWDNFTSRTQNMNFLPILIYGNHDGNNNTGGYDKFQSVQNIINGTNEFMFSFDCGKWHFVTIPCDVDWDFEEDVLTWLDADLRQNRNKPVMLFQHEHLVPQGLTQLEWYTYRKPFRKKIMDTLARYGNVKYSICGHVHNGIQTSVKTAWTWKGINFITAPTCTASRPFGEDYDEYSAGLDQGNGDTGGGYYMVFEVDGENITLKARLANTPEVYTYDKKFREYNDDDFLWRHFLSDYVPSPSLVNGSFENGLDGWFMQHRYVMDEDPMFYWKVSSDKSSDGSKALHFRVHEAGQNWANDEFLVAHQWLANPQYPVFDINYLVDNEPVGGGGFVRITCFNGDTFKNVFMVDWGGIAQEKAGARNISRNYLYEIDTYNGMSGTRGAADGLADMGDAQEAMFWTVPYEPFDSWHSLRLNLRQAWDDMFGSGAWNSLGIDRIYFTIGNWTLPDPGSRNDTWFDGIAMKPEETGDITSLDGTPLTIDNNVFHTDFGQNYR